MKIKQVTCSNFKGRDFTFELGDVSLIIAGNFEGKSAVPTAIRLGLSGWLPLPLGKQPASLYKLAGNQDEAGEMSVSLLMDNGRTVKQKWVKGANGKVSTEGGVAADLAMPELLMEPKQFFAKTGAERIKTIFECCDIKASGYGAALILGRLTSVDAKPAAICEATLDTVEKLVAAEFGYPGVTLQRSTENLIAKLKDLGKQANDAAKQASGAFQAFRTKVQGDRPKDVAAALAEKRARIVDLKARQTGGDVSVLKQTLARVESNIAAMTRQFNNPVMPAEQLLVEKLKQLETDLKSLKPVAAYDSSEDLEELNGDYASKYSELDECTTAITGAEVELAVVEKFELCAKCSKKIVATTKNKLKVLRATWDKLALDKSSVKDAIVKVEQKAKDWQDYRDKRDSITAIIAGTKAALNQLKGLLSDRDAAQQMIEGVDKPDPKLALEIAGCQVEIEDLQAKDNAFQQYRRDLERRDELEEDLLTNQCKAEVYKAVTKIVVEEQEKVAAFAFNDVLALTRNFTDGLINSPLEFRDGDLGRRVNQGDIDTGCKAPIGSWISNETFSGFELAMTLNAFGIALCKNAPLKLVLVDDIIVAPERKVTMARRFLKLVADGVINQAIIVDVDADDYRGMTEGEITVINV